jgi:bifunctional oligoribonuclease and PAP phosphatase NrnA
VSIGIALEQTADALERAHHVVVASHVNPDGDAVGSLLALTHLFTALGLAADPVLVDGVPEIYRWLPGMERIQRSAPRPDYDIGVICDAGALIRVGSSLVPTFERVPILINIDHHIADGSFGTIQVIDDKAAATTELVYDLIRLMEARRGQTILNADIAQCLMTGIVTDTGSFKYPNVRPQTLEIAGVLTALGAHPAPINELVYESRSYANVKLLGRALEQLQRSQDGRVAWTFLSKEDFVEFNATDEDSEGIVNHVRAIRGVDIAIFFREIGGKIRISLRARDGQADVNKLANQFGGGGHRLAAGCSVEMPLSVVMNAVAAAAQSQLSTFPAS